MGTQFERARLRFELLDERVVPSSTPDADLTSAGAVVQLDANVGEIFRQTDQQPTGTGFIQSFVRLQANGSGSQLEQGFNTDARPLQFDENKSPQFTRALRLSDIPVMNIGGTNYREFLLDINQKSSQPFLSLDQLRIFIGGAGNLTGYDVTTGALPGASLVYDLDGGGLDRWVKLDARLTHGSGSGDMVLDIPNSLFEGAAANSFVYLFSQFGTHFTAVSGFEEWAVSTVCMHGTIKGLVSDANSGGGLADVFVFLDANHNGVWDAGEVFTFTDETGHYEFDSLVAGQGAASDYWVTVVPPDGFTVVGDTSILVSLLTCDQTETVNFSLTSGSPGS